MTSWFEEWLNQEKPDPDRLSMDCISNLNRFDIEGEEDIRREMKQYRLERDKFLDTAPDTGGHLWSDAFHGLFKAVPKLHDRSAVRPSHLINLAVEQELRKLNEYERLRQWTVGDMMASGWALSTIRDELEQVFDRTKTAQKEAQQLQQKFEEWLQSQEGQQQFEELVNAMIEAGDLSEEDLARLQAIREAIDADMKALMTDLAGLGEQVDDAVDQSNLGALLAPAVGKAADEAEAVNDAMTGWGKDPGEVKRMDPQRRIELANRIRNSPKLRLAADFWGAMSRIANTEQSRKVYYLPEEVYDIEQGDDLFHVLPHEFAALDEPIQQFDFYRRLADGELLQYKMRGTEKLGKGGIIFCMDNSGSMAGQKEMWAKAVGLCAFQIAREQKRAFIGYHFANANSLKRFDFSNPDNVELEQVLEYAEHFFSGGTAFEPPLAAALRDLQQELDDKGYVSGDIIFCTDGMAPLNPDFITKFKEAQEKLGFKVHGIACGCSAKSEPLATICDGNVTTVQGLIDVNARDATEEIRGIFRDL